MSPEPPGTEGYERDTKRFIAASQSLSFEHVCGDLLSFLPQPPASVMDLGAGAGQNAAALARLGYSVTAVEPVSAFLEAGRTRYRELPITWIQGALPDLAALGSRTEQADFVLIEAMWHHLCVSERDSALSRVASLLAPGGACAISLRNGPAGLGTRVYPTSVEETLQQAQQKGLQCIFQKQHLPSILPNKPEVFWARIVLKKCQRSAEEALKKC
ncbi:MAG: class I SAM-dependent methyltransferase [Pseudomonadota bacterium]